MTAMRFMAAQGEASHGALSMALLAHYNIAYQASIVLSLTW